MEERVGGTGGARFPFDESGMEVASDVSVATVEAVSGWLSASGRNVGSGFCKGDLRVPGGVSAGGDCFVHERTGEVAGWVNGAWGTDDACGI